MKAQPLASVADPVAQLEADEARLTAELAACRHELLRQRVLAAVAARPGSTCNQIVERTRGGHSRVLRALQALKAEGSIEWSPGTRGAMAWRPVHQQGLVHARNPWRGARETRNVEER